MVDNFTLKLNDNFDVKFIHRHYFRKLFVDYDDHDSHSVSALIKFNNQGNEVIYETGGFALDDIASLSDDVSSRIVFIAKYYQLAVKIVSENIESMYQME